VWGLRRFLQANGAGLQQVALINNVNYAKKISIKFKILKITKILVDQKLKA
jgi:hypothetical protein